MKNKKHLTYHQWIKVWEFGCLYRVMVINHATGNIERRIFTGKDIKKYFRKHWQQLIKPAELQSQLTKLKNKDISVAVRMLEGACVNLGGYSAPSTNNTDWEVKVTVFDLPTGIEVCEF